MKCVNNGRCRSSKELLIDLKLFLESGEDEQKECAVVDDEKALKYFSTEDEISRSTSANFIALM